MYVYLVLGSFCCLSVSFCHFPWKSLVYDVYVDSLPVLFFFVVASAVATFVVVVVLFGFLFH